MFNNSLCSFKFGVAIAVPDIISFNVKRFASLRTPAHIPRCWIAKEQEAARQGTGSGLGSASVECNVT